MADFIGRLARAVTPTEQIGRTSKRHTPSKDDQKPEDIPEQPSQPVSEDQGLVHESPAQLPTGNMRGKLDDPSYVNIEGHAETGYPADGEHDRMNVGEASDVAPAETPANEDVVQSGYVNEHGEIIDMAGNVIGRLEGDFESGSVVDQDGDILDHEGNVIAKTGAISSHGTEHHEAVEMEDNEGSKIMDDKAAGSQLGSLHDVEPEPVQEDKPSATSFLNAGMKAHSHISEAIKSAKGEPTSPVDSAKDLGDDVSDIAPEQHQDNEDGQESHLGDAVDLQPERPDGVASKLSNSAQDLGDSMPDGQDPLEKAEASATSLVDKGETPAHESAEGIAPDADAVSAAETVTKSVPVEGAESDVPESVWDIHQDGVEVAPNTAGQLDDVENASDKSQTALPEGIKDMTDAMTEKTSGDVEAPKSTAETVADQEIEQPLEETGQITDVVEDMPVPDLSVLEGLVVNKAGNIVDSDGTPRGKLVEGDPKKLAGKKVDKDGKIWNDSGKIIGQAEVLPESVEHHESPFESFPDAKVDKNGIVMFENQQVGVVVEGDIAKLVGKTVDEDGDILDKHGNAIGKAERKDAEEPVEPEPEPEQVIDCSMLDGLKVNKAGNVVDDKGNTIGRVVQGILKLVIGRKVDKNGDIWNDAGKKIGRAEPLPDDEREDARGPAPFEDFPDAIVEKSGLVKYQDRTVGKVVEGDAGLLAGKKVDADGDIVDKNGNVLGRAERYEEEEPEPEPEVDMSILAGKRVNKIGNVVDSQGVIYGRLIEGDVKRLAGKMCDKLGCVRNEGGDVIGKAELVPEAEREGLKEGPFADFVGCTVAKDGKIVTSTGEVVGRLIDGDAQRLFGRVVDEDGDVLDRNGNVLGKAERWEEAVEAKDVSAMSGRRVNKQGDVVDENGDVIGKLTEGDLRHCVGKKIDDDGDVVDGKGATIGHCTLLEYIPEPEPEAEPEPEPEPEEDPEEVAARKQAEQDRKLAGQIAACIEQSLDRIKPILSMISLHIDRAERTPKDELDEEELVKQVRPLIEEGGKILTETNGAIRGLDPDGRIAAQAKSKTAAHEASPEEYRLAEMLKELTGHVHETIENAKRKLEGMPHAKKELNPLWGLLAEPLGQILAAVGLLLSGVLGLVGRLLGVLGLGGLIDNLLGGLGLRQVLEGLGLRSFTDSLRGGKKSGGKGLLG